MKSFLLSMALLLSGAAPKVESVELNEGEPRRVSFEEAQRLLGEVPSVTYEGEDQKSSQVRIPDVKLDEVCIVFSASKAPTMESTFQFHAFHLTSRARPDILVTVSGCSFRRGMLRATLFSFDGTKYRPSWVQPLGYDYNSVGDIRDLDQDGLEELLFISSNSSVYSSAPQLYWGREGKVVSEEFNGHAGLHKKGKKYWLRINAPSMDADKEDELTCFRWDGAKAGPVKAACPR